MAMTLVESSKYSNDVLQIGVIEKLVYQDPILERLQFKDIRGNGLTYVVEATMSGAGFYAPGDTWVESTSTVDQQTAVTTILGGDADVDNFLKATRSDLQDLMTEQINAKIKAVRKKFLEMFWYGYTTVDTKGFNGMHYLIRSVTSPYRNVVAVASDNSTPVALSMSKLEEGIDLVKDGKPDLIVMTKQMRRNINKYLITAGGITHSDLANRRVQTLFEIPVAVSDYLSDDENVNENYYGTVYGHEYEEGTALATDENSTTIFILRFAPEACCGLQSGGGLTTEKWDKLETKDASRVRIKWYPSLMFQNILTCAKVTGIKNDTATA